MQTIEFVLRSSVGSFQEGSLTGESGNTTIFLQTGDQVSLHLARHQVAGTDCSDRHTPRSYPIAGPTYDDY